MIYRVSKEEGTSAHKQRFFSVTPSIPQNCVNHFCLLEFRGWQFSTFIFSYLMALSKHDI